jgi:hypothetical protein
VPKFRKTDFSNLSIHALHVFVDQLVRILRTTLSAMIRAEKFRKRFETA